MDLTNLRAEDLEDLVKRINEEKKRRHEEAEAKEWPKSHTYYLHANKEDNYDQGRMLGLSPEALQTFSYICYEIELELEIHRDGTTYITEVECVPLQEKVKIS